MALSFYLQHFFDPDMAHLQPKVGRDKKTDLYNLGFVQNVKEHQLLAQFIPLEKVEKPDERFIYDEPIFPMGSNTYLDPKNPLRLLALKNGYVLYNAEKILVKAVFNLHSDVSFHTGNISFIGDANIYGNVRSGFHVYGENVIINGMIEGGKVQAKQDLTIAGGARGGVSKQCVLKANNTIRLSFTEKIEVRTRGNVLVTKYALHSNFYAGNNAIIQEHLIGGNLHALKGVYVGQKLGNRANVTTRIFLGYDPLLIRKLEKIDNQISDFSEKIHHLNAVAGHLPPETNELTHRLAVLRKKMNTYFVSRNKIWNTLHEDEAMLEYCKVVAVGDVFPGVEISIGRSFYQVTKHMNCVEFALVDNEIVCRPHQKKTI